MSNHQQTNKLVVSELQISRSGPLPPPNELQKYNEIIPNGAERLMALYEKQVEHRIELEKTVIKADVKKQTLGQIFAFIITMVITIAGVVLLLCDKRIEGLTSIIVALASLVGVFVYGVRSQRKERIEKDKHNK